MTNSAEPLAIGLDFGTGALKLLVTDARGCGVAERTAAYPTSFTADGACTQKPADWARALARAFASLPHDIVRRVGCVSITAPAHVVVLMDHRDRVVAPALLAWDRRPTAESAALLATHGPEIYARTWTRVGPSWPLVQLRYLGREIGPRLRTVATVIPQKDYVRFLLTGERCTDASDAAGTALFDQAEGTWDCELSRLAGVDLSALLEIRLPWASGGVVTVSGARRTGLRRGTPVIVGATDTAAELISLGLVAEGWLAKIASTGTVVAVDGAPRPDPLVMTYPHVTADVWYQVAATNFAAQSRTWAARILGLDATTASGAAAFDRLASRAPAGSHGLLFLPFLAGERTPYWDSELRAAFVGLTAAHSRADLARAVLEGVAFSIRACRAALGDTRGQLTLSGGGVRSSLWRRILVSALGERARLVAPQGPALGAALLALAASYDRPLKPPPGRRVTSVAPNAAWCASYDRLYRIYQDAAAAMTSISHRLQR